MPDTDWHPRASLGDSNVLSRLGSGVFIFISILYSFILFIFAILTVLYFGGLRIRDWIVQSNRLRRPWIPRRLVPWDVSNLPSGRCSLSLDLAETVMIAFWAHSAGWCYG